MKLALAIALTAATTQAVLAQPHGHSHHHRRHIQNVSVVKRDTETIYVDEAGRVLSKDNVCAGLAANKLRLKDGEVAPEDLCDKSVPTPPAPEPTSSVAAAAFYDKGASTAEAPEPTSEPEAKAPEPSPQQGPSGGQGLGSDFPDGELDCGTFPSDYGALSLEYLGMGGWAGIQKVSYAGNFVSDIHTGISGDSCSEGNMCSYACPPGTLKSQWPSTQGATGQSVGGLECSGGKLKLTNPDLSKSLCIPGTGGVKAQNKAGQVVSICRTDYPGTESETIPTVLNAGETQELACPDSHTYYKWKDMATSAQYYLNPIGVGPEKACRWGDGSEPIGNWAPINFGVSKKGKYYHKYSRTLMLTNI